MLRMFELGRVWQQRLDHVRSTRLSQHPAAKRASAPGLTGVWNTWAYPIVLAGILLLAVALRLYRLVPLSQGLLYAQDADEGVYATTAQLALQGYVPYRDFFTPMPPVAIYLYMLVLRGVYHLWGSPTGLMALRYVSVACGAATVFLVSWIAKAVGGKRASLLAAAVIAVDGIVVAQDRRAMLEAPANLLSLLAIIFYLRARGQADAGAQTPASRRESAVCLAMSGLCCTSALLAKGTALVPIAVIGLCLLAGRHWRHLLIFSATLAVSYLVLAGPFLALCPADYVRQNYVFHLLRPWDGTAHPLARLLEMWSYPWSWATVRLALAGTAVALLAQHRMRRKKWLWVIGAWAGVVLLLLLTSKTYWATYFSQLAVPLSILCGMLVGEELGPGLHSVLDRIAPRLRLLTGTLQLVALMAVLILGHARVRLQAQTTRAALEQTKPAYMEIARAINQLNEPTATILVFETNYTFLTSHPPAGAREGSFFVDSYGEMLYRNLGIPAMSAADVVATWRRGERVTSKSVFWQPDSQAEVLRVLQRADYVVLDGRGLKQLTQETASRIVAGTTAVHSAFGSELRRLNTSGPTAADTGSH